jgi:TPR repeat protein
MTRNGRALVAALLLLLAGPAIQLAAQETSPMAESDVAVLRQAAEGGDAAAQYRLGRMYFRGEGVPKDDAEAIRWSRKAAEQGYAAAQRNLGVAYAKGQGVPKDEAEAVRWYRKAAEQGDARAQVNIGWAYASGRGVAKDEREAVRWYRRAAEQGYAAAQLNLGAMYDRSCPYICVEGVEKGEREGEAPRCVGYARDLPCQGGEELSPWKRVPSLARLSKRRFTRTLELCFAARFA